ncbi:hypothetical protein [Halomonas sp.]|uniref:hypothetical protein n=1 Tax=Halomonas sp. TaxID=1486246 RepID=UPI00263119E2|nr:hypothetical protein [Halomonas sp.]
MNEQLLPIERFLWTLDIVQREGNHLAYSWRTLFEAGQSPSSEWVATLDQRPEDAIRLEAFVSRYSRMQDTIADKLIPRWLQSLAERVGIDVLPSLSFLGSCRLRREGRGFLRRSGAALSRP